MLGAEADGHEGGVALDIGMLAAVDESGVEGFLAAGVETVVGHITHLLHARWLDADVLPLLGVVGEGEAEGVDAHEALAADGEGDDVAGVDLLLVGRDGDDAGHGSHTAAADTALQLDAHGADVIGVDEAVAVEVATRDVALEVAVALTQAGVVQVAGEVILVDAVVVVDVAGNHHLCLGVAEDIDLLAAAKAAARGFDMEANIAHGAI